MRAKPPRALRVGRRLAWNLANGGETGGTKKLDISFADIGGCERVLLGTDVELVMTRLMFDMLITPLTASFEDVLQGFGTQVDSCSSRFLVIGRGCERVPLCLAAFLSCSCGLLSCHCCLHRHRKIISLLVKTQP